MDSTQRTIILIKAQALKEAAEDWERRSQEWAAEGKPLLAQTYNFMAMMATGRSRALELSTYFD